MICNFQLPGRMCLLIKQWHGCSGNQPLSGCVIKPINTGIVQVLLTWSKAPDKEAVGPRGECTLLLNGHTVKLPSKFFMPIYYYSSQPRPEKYLFAVG